MRALLRHPLFVSSGVVFLIAAAFAVRWLYFQFPLNNELLHAARDGDVHEMEALVRRGANVNSRGERFWTPLTGAAERGQSGAAAWLLDHGADPNYLEGGGNTALFWAAFKDRGDIAELLLRRGADPNRKGGSARNLSPLAIAETEGHAELAARLRAAGAR